MRFLYILSLLFVLAPFSTLAQGTTPTFQVKTMADLVAIPIPVVNNRLTALVSGAFTENDGYGGNFYYATNSTAAIDGGITLKPASANGRWIRQEQTPVNLGWFGQSAIQTALNTAKGKSLVVPSDVFTTAGELLADNVKISGPGTLKLANAANTILLTLTNGATVQGVTFDGNKAGQTSIGTWPFTSYCLVRVASQTRVSGCTFSNSYGGSIFGQALTNTVIEDNLITGCNGTPPMGNNAGFEASIYLYAGVSQATIRGNLITNCPISGIFVVSDPGSNQASEIKLLNNTVDYRGLATFDSSTLNPTSGAFKYVNSEIQGIVTFGGVDHATYQGNYVYGTRASWVDAINTTTDVITSTNHLFVNGNQVYMQPAQGGVTGGQLYYVIAATANTLQLSTTPGGTAVDITASDFSIPIRLGGPKVFHYSLDRTSNSSVVNNFALGNGLLGIENNSGTNNTFLVNTIRDAGRGFYDIAQAGTSSELRFIANTITESLIAAMELRGQGHGNTIVANYFEDSYVGSDATLPNAALLNLTVSDTIVSDNWFVHKRTRSTLNGNYGAQLAGCSNLTFSGNHFMLSPYGNMTNVQCAAAYLTNTHQVQWTGNHFSSYNESGVATAPQAIDVAGSGVAYGHSFSGNHVSGFTAAFVDASKFGPTPFIGNIITNSVAGILNPKTNDLVVLDGLFNKQRLGPINQLFGDGSTNDVFQIWQSGFPKSAFDADGNLTLGTYLFGVAPFVRLHSQSGTQSSIRVWRANTPRWDEKYLPTDYKEWFSWGKSGTPGVAYTFSPDGDFTASGTVHATNGYLGSGAALTFPGTGFLHVTAGVQDGARAINLATADVTGNLGISHFNSGTGANASTYWRGDGLWVTNSGSGTNGGTVTSVSMTVPAFLSVAGSPITSAGSLDLTLSGVKLPLANEASPTGDGFAHVTGGAWSAAARNPVLASTDFLNQGTVTTILHGNSSGNPSWGAVNLATETSGNLAVSHLNSGAGAGAGTYWQGDGTWGTPAGSTPTFTYAHTLINYTFPSGNIYLRVEGAGLTITLPSAIGITGQSVIVKETTIVPNSTIVTQFGQTINDSLTSYSLTSEEDSVVFVSDGANWNIVSIFRNNGVWTNGPGVPGSIPVYTDSTSISQSSGASIDGGGNLTVGGSITGFGSATFDGNITFNTAGSVLSVKSGTGQRAGNLTLAGGTRTVANSTVSANTIVMLTRKTSGGTIGTAITYTLSAGASFTVNSDNILDTSTFSYFLVEVP